MHYSLETIVISIIYVSNGTTTIVFAFKISCDLDWTL